VVVGRWFVVGRATSCRTTPDFPLPGCATNHRPLTAFHKDTRAMAKEKELNLKIRPLDDRVVVEPLEAEEKTAGGLYLPDTAKQKPQRGRVLAVGPGKLLDNGQRGALSVAKGDEVIYGRYSGSEIEVEGREIKIMRESDILAKISK
jgi:chaperonin GroES